jgi:hypothetical protein
MLLIYDERNYSSAVGITENSAAEQDVCVYLQCNWLVVAKLMGYKFVLIDCTIFWV